MNDSASDDQLVRAFETATLDGSKFHHREHLYVAFTYLRALPIEAALARYVHHLRKLAEELGVPEKFHRTMTWGWLLLLDEAMQCSPELAFDELLATNTSLSDPNALHVYYTDEVLRSDSARKRFVLPRRE